jgi:hypothetical protein
MGPPWHCCSPSPSSDCRFRGWRRASLNTISATAPDKGQSAVSVLYASSHVGAPSSAALTAGRNCPAIMSTGSSPPRAWRQHMPASAMIGPFPSACLGSAAPTAWGRERGPARAIQSRRRLGIADLTLLDQISLLYPARRADRGRPVARVKAPARVTDPLNHQRELLTQNFRLARVPGTVSLVLPISRPSAHGRSMPARSICSSSKVPRRRSRRPLSL